MTNETRDYAIYVNRQKVKEVRSTESEINELVESLGIDQGAQILAYRRAHLPVGLDGAGYWLNNSLEIEWQLIDGVIGVDLSTPSK